MLKNKVKIGPASYFRTEHGLEIDPKVPDNALVVAWNSLDETFEWDWEVQVDYKGGYIPSTPKTKNICRNTCTDVANGDVVVFVGG
jgi:hypothetical protein